MSSQVPFFYIIPFLSWWSKAQEKDYTDRYVLGDGPEQTVMDVDIYINHGYERMCIFQPRPTCCSPLLLTTFWLSNMERILGGENIGL